MSILFYSISKLNGRPRQLRMQVKILLTYGITRMAFYKS